MYYYLVCRFSLANDTRAERSQNRIFKQLLADYNFYKVNAREYRCPIVSIEKGKAIARAFKNFIPYNSVVDFLYVPEEVYLNKDRYIGKNYME